MTIQRRRSERNGDVSGVLPTSAGMLERSILSTMAFGFSMVTSLLLFAAQGYSHIVMFWNETLLLVMWLLCVGILGLQGVLVLVLLRRRETSESDRVAGQTNTPAADSEVEPREAA